MHFQYQISTVLHCHSGWTMIWWRQTCEGCRETVHRSKATTPDLHRTQRALITSCHLPEKYKHWFLYVTFGDPVVTWRLESKDHYSINLYNTDYLLLSLGFRKRQYLTLISLNNTTGLEFYWVSHSSHSICQRLEQGSLHNVDPCNLPV